MSEYVWYLFITFRYEFQQILKFELIDTELSKIAC